MAEIWDHCEIPASEGGLNRDLPNSSDMFSDKFPEGLRVLVFDKDPQYLLILQKYLQEFQYQVIICNDEEKAMYLLCNHMNVFDIAIIEVQNSDCDRLRVISKIGSRMNLPIVMISKDDSVKSVIYWMRNGASDYLIKPIRPEDLRLIYKHVAKKKQGRRSVAAVVAGEKSAAEKSSSVGDTTIRNPNDGKQQVNEEEKDHDRDRACNSKKRRVVWDDELHKKFIEAMNDLGNDKAVPKKILEKMNVEGITRENVASHLQKYRMNQKKLNDHNEREKRNRSLIEGLMYSGDEATTFYGVTNLQFPTHDTNNIPHSSSGLQQYHTTNPNFVTQPSPLGHHHAVSVAVSDRNLTMSHQHHQHQNLEFTCVEKAEESLIYENIEMHNENEIVGENLDFWFMPNSEEVGLFHFEEPVMTTSTMVPNDHHASTSNSFETNPQQMSNVHDTHEPSISYLPSCPCSCPHCSFLDQKETLTMVDVSGVCTCGNAYCMNNKLT